MPEQLKDISVRIHSIQSTLQITKAMKIASVTKLKKAQDLAHNFLPYARGAEDMLAQFLRHDPRSVEDFLHPTKNKASAPRPVLYLVIGSDKGLCGGYNTNLMRKVRCDMEANYKAALRENQVHILPIGKKPLHLFRRRDFPLLPEYEKLYASPQLDGITACVDALIAKYREGAYGDIQIAYNHFASASAQVPSLRRLLPLCVEAKKPLEKTAIHYESGSGATSQALLLTYLRAFLYAAILDAQAAEHSARVTAMDQASENANKILEVLKVDYNRARQSIITNEIIEIISGAASLE